jgi:hypothetical protein
LAVPLADLQGQYIHQQGNIFLQLQITPVSQALKEIFTNLQAPFMTAITMEKKIY